MTNQQHTVLFNMPDGSVVMVPVGPVTIQHPAPPSDGPAIPAGLVNVGAKLFDSTDPTSTVWDCGAGGSQVFGLMNGVSCKPANVAMIGGAVAMVTDSAAGGATITTLPRNDPTNGRPGTGAKAGFAFGAAIVEVEALWAGTGSADAWDGCWSEPVAAKPENPYQATGGEYDFAEMARWPGGNGLATASYHYGPGNQKNPNAIDLGPVFDGKRHKHTLIRTAGNCWICRDGQQIGPAFPCKDNLVPHFLILTKGAGKPSVTTFYRARVWAIGA